MTCKYLQVKSFVCCEAIKSTEIKLTRYIVQFSKFNNLEIEERNNANRFLIFFMAGSINIFNIFMRTL